MYTSLIDLLKHYFVFKSKYNLEDNSSNTKEDNSSNTK